MRALEQQFGVVIVKRGRAYAGLTPEGEKVLATAQRILREYGLLQQELSSEADRPRGRIRLGAVPTAIPVLARFAALLQARHPGIVPVVLSMSSQELEAGLETLTLDLALGYTERMKMARNAQLTSWPQYTEHYFLLRRAAKPGKSGLRIGPKMKWKDAARFPIALLTPEMHNRTIIDSAFVTAGAPIKPAIETNSILTLALGVIAGDVCAVMPGGLVSTVRNYGELEALPLASPDIRTPIGFMAQAGVRASRALDAAIAMAQDAGWLRHAAAHSGLLTA
jgi:DNA-binding transcriptional LysR family regulator